MERREGRGGYKRDRRGLVGCSQEFSVSQTAWTTLGFHHCGESDSVRIFKWLLMSGSGRAFSLSPRLRPQLCSAPACSSPQRWALDRGVRPRASAVVHIFCTCAFIANMPAKSAQQAGEKKPKTQLYYMTDLQGATKGRKCFVCFMVITGN